MRKDLARIDGIARVIYVSEEYHITMGPWATASDGMKHDFLKRAEEMVDIIATADTEVQALQGGSGKIEAKHVIDVLIALDSMGVLDWRMESDGPRCTATNGWVVWLPRGVNYVDQLDAVRFQHPDLGNVWTEIVDDRVRNLPTIKDTPYTTALRKIHDDLFAVWQQHQTKDAPK